MGLQGGSWDHAWSLGKLQSLNCTWRNKPLRWDTNAAGGVDTAVAQKLKQPSVGLEVDVGQRHQQCRSGVVLCPSPSREVGNQIQDIVLHPTESCLPLDTRAGRAPGAPFAV